MDAPIVIPTTPPVEKRESDVDGSRRVRFSDAVETGVVETTVETEGTGESPVKGREPEQGNGESTNQVTLPQVVVGNDKISPEQSPRVTVGEKDFRPRDGVHGYYEGIGGGGFVMALDKGPVIKGPQGSKRAVPPIEEVRSALLQAVVNESLVKTQEQIENGADLNQKFSKGMRAIHYACANGAEPIARLLVRHGASISHLSDSQWSVAHFAANNGHETILRMLDSFGADLNLRDVRGRVPLHLCAKRAAEGKSTENCCRFLVQRGMGINARDGFKKTPLHYAAVSTVPNVVNTILEGCATEAQAEIDARDSNGATPVMLAAREDLEDVVGLLLQRGANANIRDNVGKTALHYACQHSHESVALLLASHGGYLDVPDQKKITPMGYAPPRLLRLLEKVYKKQRTTPSTGLRKGKTGIGGLGGNIPVPRLSTGSVLSGFESIKPHQSYSPGRQPPPQSKQSPRRPYYKRVTSDQSPRRINSFKGTSDVSALDSCLTTVGSPSYKDTRFKPNTGKGRPIIVPAKKETPAVDDLSDSLRMNTMQLHDVRDKATMKRDHGAVQANATRMSAPAQMQTETTF